VSHEEWVAAQFQRCRPWIEKALARQPLPTHTIEHVREALESGNCMLWPTPNAATVVEVVEHPTGLKTLHHWLAGGSLKELQATEARVAEWGRQNGFAAVTISGREGWSRTLRGYRKATSYLVKDLT
jgi:hypothetical protein